MSSDDDGGVGRRRPRRRRRWPLALAAVYGLATAVAYVAWVFVGDAWWLQPVNLTTFWWTVPALPLVLAAIVARRPRVAAFLVLPALLWAWFYGPLFLPQSVVGDPELRLATFNTFVQTADAAHVVAFAEAYDPDVLVLQEVFPPRQDVLDAALADLYPFRVAVQSEGVGGLAVLSRFPVIEERPVTEPVAASRTTEVVVLDIGGQAVQVVPVHLLSPCPTCGTSVSERLELEGEVRSAEVGEVLDALDPDLPAVVAGDFNSTDRSGPYRRLAEAGFTDPHRDVGSGPGFTWPNDSAVGAVFRIDWILVRGLEPVSAFVADGGPSDHRPVVADLRF